jgi:hypothetical protein
MTWDDHRPASAEGKRMNTDSTTARLVGTLFIVATVASLAGSAALGGALDGPDYLADLAAQQGRIILAALLFLVAATSAFATAFLLFPILRRYAEGLAAGYVGLRAFENVLYIAGAVVGLLAMLTVSQHDAIGSASGLPLLGATLLAIHDWSILIGTLLFAGIGGTTLNYVLFRSRLVPRWLATWGLIGALLLVCYGIAGTLGWDTDLGSPLMILAMPIAVQEMVFAGWLIIRGFDRPTVERTRPAKPHLTATT